MLFPSALMVPVRLALPRVLLTAALLGATGCSRQLMETPNVYVSGFADPFDAVPRSLQTNEVEVLYFTDREPNVSSSEGATYGFGRSESLAFGTCSVRFGKDIGWTELVEASRTRNRNVSLPIQVGVSQEIGRTPAMHAFLEVINGRLAPSGDSVAPSRESAELIRRTLSERLALTNHKEIYLHIHGSANTFEDAVPVIAQVWHFLGRVGVPVMYTWPAGQGGLLKGYQYDRESSEFTVVHLRKLLMLLGSLDEVEKVHIIAHSRGTDVASNALHQILLMNGSDPLAARAAIKLGIVVLAAPDLDSEVVRQRFLVDRMFNLPESVVVYVSRRDKAIGISSKLFSSRRRVGRLQPEDLSEQEQQTLEALNTVMQVIDADVTGYSEFGHNYYYRHPAVSSDLVLVLTGHTDPGAQHGRPLTPIAGGFWRLDNDYWARPSPPVAADGR